MSSQSFYRKWRSQTFADVVGQGHVTRTLRNALRTGRIAHAYLLCGPRGVGKTSVARILAKGINCLYPNDGEPCNECRICVGITEGRALDVIEVDAASNRRIEEMRDLRDKVNFSPSEGRYKVYILDEAHMLTNEAHNALLKTLEEPPAHTVFVLITTEAHKIPDTIVSRCQRFNFRRISTKESAERLSMVCAREDLSVPPEALTLVARAATGSLRDAEGLLDQLVAYCGQEISVAQVQDVLGLAGEGAIIEFAEQLVSGDLGRGLELIDRIAEAGADLRRFAEDLVGYLRSVLLVRSGAEAVVLLDSSADTLATLKQFAQRVALDDLVAFIRIFSDVGTASRGGIAPQLAVELALAEAILARRAERPAPTGVERPPARPERPLTMPRRDLKPEIVRPNESVATGPVEVTPAAAAPVTTGPSEPMRAAGTLESEPNIHASAGTPPTAIPIVTKGPVAAGDLGRLLEQLRRQWDTEVVGAFGIVNKPLQALLRSCGPYQVRGDAIIIGCDSQFHRDTVGQGTQRRLLDQRLRELFGTHVPLEFDVMPRQMRGQLPAATSDPLVKEVLSWGGRIKAVVSDDDNNSESGAEHAGRISEEGMLTGAMDSPGGDGEGE